MSCIRCGGTVPRGGYRPYCLKHAAYAQKVMAELAKREKAEAKLERAKARRERARTRQEALGRMRLEEEKLRHARDMHGATGVTQDPVKPAQGDILSPCPRSEAS